MMQKQSQVVLAISYFSKLNHPSVLRFIFFDKYNFKHEERPVIVTEYAHNGSLEDFIGLNSKSHLDDTHKLIIIYGIASGSHNIIHHDLKPSNILLDESLNPKIADFGMSKIEDQSHKSVSDLKRTPCYISPEIFERYEYSKRRDVYAFGIIIYELLTNEKVFNEKTSQQIIELLNSGYRPEFTSQIADSYKKLIEKC